MLEARFYPERRSNPRFLVVGHLLWKNRHPDDDPVFQPARVAASPMTSKLLYLLNAAKPDCFNRLQSLRSEFWCFVEISGSRDSGYAAAARAR